MKDDYTRLLEAAAELEDAALADAAVTKLILHLKSSGRLKMLPQIARALRKVAGKRKALEPVLEVAHQSEATAALEEARALGIEAKRAQVNHALIRGWRGRSHGLLVDKSAKQALITLYKNVTA